MSEHHSLRLVYGGPALADHQMNVRDLAPALLAFANLVDRANELLNGNAAKVSVNVKGSFKQGSFAIDFALEMGWLQSVIKLVHGEGAPDLQSLLDLLGFLGEHANNVLSLTALGVGGGYTLVRIIKWLKGRKLTNVTVLDDGKVRLEIGDEHIEIEERAYRLLEDYKVRKAFEDAIAEPLSREGIDELAIIDTDASEVLVHVNREEAAYFRSPPASEQQLDSQESIVALRILNVAFQDGNKWRFTDGSSAFHAQIRDDGFLNKVALNQEVFAKDDVLVVRMTKVQRVSTSGELQADCFIEEVLEHKSVSPKVQLRLEFPKE